ncbi:fluoride efflux transporter CrcB [Aestuariibacter salexigens]|uniref:fluoride efflux transporter CrcB n=1 Tax=Aestuariibacter salexigens TaxID=226010 RepID=UPI00040D719D|nr:fluoride efflux transporter CrcB [Aestuariibacter salexigens]
MQATLQLYLSVAVGGAIGACLRFFITQWAFQWFGKGFPFGTLIVNVAGSFLLGILYSLIEHEHMYIVPWRTMLGIGFLGALTTFSTFSVDSLLLLQQGLWLKAMLNVMLNVCCCLAAVWLAIQLVKG